MTEHILVNFCLKVIFANFACVSSCDRAGFGKPLLSSRLELTMRLLRLCLPSNCFGKVSLNGIYYLIISECLSNYRK